MPETSTHYPECYSHKSYHIYFLRLLRSKNYVLLWLSLLLCLMMMNDYHINKNTKNSNDDNLMTTSQKRHYYARLTVIRVYQWRGFAFRSDCLHAFVQITNNDDGNCKFVWRSMHRTKWTLLPPKLCSRIIRVLRMYRVALLRRVTKAAQTFSLAQFLLPRNWMDSMFAYLLCPCRRPK